MVRNLRYGPLTRLVRGISGFREKYKYIQDKRMFWELLKMEIRCFTISFAKGKAKETRNRELIIKEEMDRLDHVI